MQVSSFPSPSASSSSPSRGSSGSSTAGSADSPGNTFADLLTLKTASPAPAKSTAMRDQSASPGKSTREPKQDDNTTAQEEAAAAMIANLLTVPPTPVVGTGPDTAAAIDPTATPTGAAPSIGQVAAVLIPDGNIVGSGAAQMPLLGTPANSLTSASQVAAPATAPGSTAIPPSAATDPRAMPAPAAAALVSAASSTVPSVADPAGPELRAISVESTPGQDGVKLTVPAAALGNPSASAKPDGTDTPRSVLPEVPAAPSAALPAATTLSAGPIALPEKIAAASEVSVKAPGASVGSDQKKSLVAAGDDVETDGNGVGINAAQAKTVMPAVAIPSSPPAPSDHSALAAVAPMSSDAAKEAPALPAPVAAQVATHAVETALAAADRLAAGTQRSVNLQFSVSGVDLGVRVEMRGDAVHTTFHTDSPELRTAISQEWQAVTAQNESRPQRLADPVFSSGSHSGLGQSADGSAHQRDSGPRQGQAAGPEFTVFRPGARPAATTSVSAEPASSRLVPSLTTRHLHTFA